MSTGMPPPPNAAMPAPAPLSSEPQQPALSQGARIINTFFAPRKTFEDLKRNASWWVPWLLGAIVTLAFGIIAVQKIDMVQFSRKQVEQSKLAQRQFEQLTPEQQEQNLRLRASISKFAFYVTPVIILVFGLIYAAVLMGVFNFGFVAEVSFGKALAIVFYSFLPKLIQSILLMVSLLVSSDPNSIDISANPMPTNLGFFMDPQGNKFLYSLASNLDLFALWIVVLMGLGFAVVSTNRKLTPSKGITVMFVVYGILILIGAGIKAAF